MTKSKKKESQDLKYHSLTDTDFNTNFYVYANLKSKEMLNNIYGMSVSNPLNNEYVFNGEESRTIERNIIYNDTDSIKVLNHDRGC